MKLQSLCKESQAPCDTTVLSITYRFIRNISRYTFPGKLSEAKRKQVLLLLRETLLKELPKAHFFSAEELSPLEKEFLSEHFCAPDPFVQAHAGEGFVVDSNGFLAVINVRNHLQIILRGDYKQKDALWQALGDLEVKLGNELSFAFLPKFGFLTADPYQCGTALTALVPLHVPALVLMGRFDKICEEYLDADVRLKGLYGPLERGCTGNVLMMTNTYTLGLTEENISHQVQTHVAKFVSAEKAAKKELIAHPKVEFIDKVSRSFGLLTHSQTLSLSEALDGLSFVSLGADIGWIKGVDAKEALFLFSSVKRAYLGVSRNVQQEDLGKERAKICKEALHGAALFV